MARSKRTTKTITYTETNTDSSSESDYAEDAVIGSKRKRVKKKNPKALSKVDKLSQKSRSYLASQREQGLALAHCGSDSEGSLSVCKNSSSNSDSEMWGKDPSKLEKIKAKLQRGRTKQTSTTPNTATTPEDQSNVSTDKSVSTNPKPPPCNQNDDHSKVTTDGQDVIADTGRRVSARLQSLPTKADPKHPPLAESSLQLRAMFAKKPPSKKRRVGHGLHSAQEKEVIFAGTKQGFCFESNVSVGGPKLSGGVVPMVFPKISEKALKNQLRKFLEMGQDLAGEKDDDEDEEFVDYDAKTDMIFPNSGGVVQKVQKESVYGPEHDVEDDPHFFHQDYHPFDDDSATEHEYHPSDQGSDSGMELDSDDLKSVCSEISVSTDEERKNLLDDRAKVVEFMQTVKSDALKQTLQKFLKRVPVPDAFHNIDNDDLPPAVDERGKTPKTANEESNDDDNLRPGSDERSEEDDPTDDENGDESSYEADTEADDDSDFPQGNKAKKPKSNDSSKPESKSNASSKPKAEGKRKRSKPKRGASLLEQAARASKQIDEGDDLFEDSEPESEKEDAMIPLPKELIPHNEFVSSSYEDSDVEDGFFKIELQAGKKRVIKPMPKRTKHLGKNRARDKATGRRPKRATGDMPYIDHSDQVDDPMRTKVNISRGYVELVQQMCMPMALQDEHKPPENSDDEDPARKKERTWPKMLFGTFMMIEQVPNQGGGVGETGNYLPRPQIHLCAGSKPAATMLKDFINSTATRWACHAEWQDFVRPLHKGGVVAAICESKRTTLTKPWLKRQKTTGMDLRRNKNQTGAKKKASGKKSVAKNAGGKKAGTKKATTTNK